MTNWSALIDTGTTNREVIQEFANGELTSRDVVNYLKFTNTAGEFRRLERTYGTQKARTLAKRALNRRGYR
jgi:hypothetical protein